MDWFVACYSLLEGTMTRNRTKVWDPNYVTVIMSTATKASRHDYRLVRHLPPRPQPQDLRLVWLRFGARPQAHPPLRIVQRDRPERRNSVERQRESTEGE